MKHIKFFCRTLFYSSRAFIWAIWASDWSAHNLAVEIANIDIIPKCENSCRNLIIIASEAKRSSFYSRIYGTENDPGTDAVYLLISRKALMIGPEILTQLWLKSETKIVPSKFGIHIFDSIENICLSACMVEISAFFVSWMGNFKFWWFYRKDPVLKFWNIL